jgi:hypothetical protein
VGNLSVILDKTEADEGVGRGPGGPPYLTPAEAVAAG